MAALISHDGYALATLPTDRAGPNLFTSTSCSHRSLHFASAASRLADVGHIADGTCLEEQEEQRIATEATNKAGKIFRIMIAWTP